MSGGRRMEQYELEMESGLKLSRQGAQSIVEEVGAVVGQNINMMDRRGYVIASTDETRIGSLHEGARKLIEEHLPELYVEVGHATPTSRPGLNLRSVGENPATADAAGINVSRNKYLATCVGAGISGLGGLYYTMDYIKGTWANDGTIESLGWLAVALVIFATWRTVNAIWGSYLFGLLFWVYLIIPGLGRRDTYLFNMLPYLVTIAVLIFVSLRNKKENQPPASLGLAYFREER